MEFTEVPKPSAEFLAQPKFRHGTFRAALALTLTNGHALQVPAKGETYAVTRNRVAAAGYGLAKKLGAQLRTAKSAEGDLLIWLEAKAVTR